jgi:xylan 1,4-beta-xylosidase
MQEFFRHTPLSPQRKTLFTGTPLCYTEGAHLYRRDGWYYLMVAEGGTSYEHAVVVLRSKTSTGRTSCTRT